MTRSRAQIFKQSNLTVSEILTNKYTKSFKWNMNLTFAPTRRANASNTLYRNSGLSFNHKYFARVLRIFMSVICSSADRFLPGSFWTCFVVPPTGRAAVISLADVENNAFPFKNFCMEEENIHLFLGSNSLGTTDYIHTIYTRISYNNQNKYCQQNLRL